MDIDGLRSEIGKVDAEILSSMKKRLEIAEQIGGYKIANGIPIRNPAVEDAVVRKYRDFAEANGMDPTGAETVCRTLIQESVERQVAALHSEHVPKSISVIGGNGKMGRWFCDMFRRSGDTVTAIDPSLDDGLTVEDASLSDVVIVSVPISAVDSVLNRLDSVCREDALIFDLSSLKTPFTDTLRRMAATRKVCSVHPMFGPSSKSMYNRNLIICDCGGTGDAVSETMSLLDNRGANIRLMDIGCHDRYISYVLGLSHAVNIAFLTVLERSGIPFDDMCSVASTTFRKNMDTNESVTTEDPKLYYEIQHLNAYSDEMWEQFSKAVEDVKRASADDDPGMFRDLMDLGRMYFGRGLQND